MRPFLIALALVCVAAALPFVAAAQPEPVQNGSVPADDCVQIDHATDLCDDELEDGTAVLTIESERPQSVTLTDSGPLLDDGGRMSQETYRLTPGRNTIAFDVTEVDGKAALTIGTNEVLYAQIVEDRASFLPGEPRSMDAAIAGIVVFLLFAIGFPAGYYLTRRVFGGVRVVW